jgi:hypothetical protein
MSTITDINRIHLHHVPGEQSLSSQFIPATYKTYGAARNAIKAIMDATGYENLEQGEKEICGQWMLITDSVILDGLFTPSEQETNSDFFKANTKVLTFSHSSVSNQNNAIIANITGTTSYIRIDEYKYIGSRYTNIEYIKCLAYTSTGGTYQIRLLDTTNGVIIGESDVQNNTTPQIFNINIASAPMTDCSIEVHVKRTSNNKATIDCLNTQYLVVI